MNFVENLDANELQENKNTVSHAFPGTIHSSLGTTILLNLTFLPPTLTIWNYRQRV